MSPDEGQEEYEEVQADLKKREEEVNSSFCKESFILKNKSLWCYQSGV